MKEKQACYLDPNDWKVSLCWQIRHCPKEWKATCPVWLYEGGHNCWEINMTYCQGKVHNPGEKKKLCYECEVYQTVLVKSGK
jgi:hypothetical protein